MNLVEKTSASFAPKPFRPPVVLDSLSSQRQRATAEPTNSSTQRFFTARRDSAVTLGHHWPFQLCQTMQKKQKSHVSCRYSNQKDTHKQQNTTSLDLPLLARRAVSCSVLPARSPTDFIALMYSVNKTEQTTTRYASLTITQATATAATQPTLNQTTPNSPCDMSPAAAQALS